MHKSLKIASEETSVVNADKRNCRNSGGNHKPDTVSSPDHTQNIRNGNSQMIRKKCTTKESCFQTERRIPVKNNFCYSSSKLPKVVSGKNGRACESISAFKASPLECGGEEKRIEGQYRIHPGRKETNHKGSRTVQKYTCKREADAGMFGEVGSQAKSQHIDCHAAQTDKGAAEIMTEKISNQINHVCSLCIAEKITKI